MAVQKEMETWRKAREVGEREERSYTDTAAGLPIPKVAVEVRAAVVLLKRSHECEVCVAAMLQQRGKDASFRYPLSCQTCSALTYKLCSGPLPHHCAVHAS